MSNLSAWSNTGDLKAGEGSLSASQSSLSVESLDEHEKRMRCPEFENIKLEIKLPHKCLHATVEKQLKGASNKSTCYGAESAVGC